MEVRIWVSYDLGADGDYAGMYASCSDWMPWELDKAKELGLNVIGVIPWGHERISQIVNSRSIVNVH